MSSGLDGLCATRSPGDLCGDQHEQAREETSQRCVRESFGQSDSALGGRRGCHAEHGRSAPANVAVARLTPGSGEDGGEDREKRRADGVVIVEPEGNQRRHEQDPAAHSEHACEHACGETEHDSEHVRHLTKSQTATPTRNAAKNSSIVRVCNRCCRAVAPITETPAGNPTSAAYSTRTSPWIAYPITPETAVIPIAASEVAVAACASQAQRRRSRGTITIPPPTPNSALKKPAARPMRTSRTLLFLQRQRRRLRCRYQDARALLVRPSELTGRPK